MRKGWFGFLIVMMPALILFKANPAQAIVRTMFLPGDARVIILLQGVSSSGMDPDPQKLYQMMAAPVVHQGAGLGKIVNSVAQDFHLSCVTQSGAQPFNVDCTFIIAASSRDRISSRSGIVEFDIDGAEARSFYERFAGVEAKTPFHWQSSQGNLRIESTPAHFHFQLHQNAGINSDQ